MRRSTFIKLFAALIPILLFTACARPIVQTKTDTLRTIETVYQYDSILFPITIVDTVIKIHQIPYEVPVEIRDSNDIVRLRVLRRKVNELLIQCARLPDTVIFRDTITNTITDIETVHVEKKRPFNWWAVAFFLLAAIVILLVMRSGITKIKI